MALPAAQSEMRFYRSGASANGLSVVDPNASLGNFRAAQEANIQSTLTAAMTQLGTLVDSTRVDDSPAGPVDTRSPLANSGNYGQAAQLLHWYRFGYDPFDLSTDYGNGTKVPLNLARGALGASDIDSGVQPGHFDQQRHSLHFNSAGAADNDALVSAAGGQTWGFSSTFTFGTWARTTTTAAGTSVLFRMAAGTGTGNAVNGVRIERQGANLVAVVCDQTTATTRKEYVYNNFFVANTWHHIVLTWDGTSMLLYKDGAAVIPDTLTADGAPVRADPGNLRLIVGGGNVGTIDPTQEWFGQIHSLAIWSVPLPTPTILTLFGIGDGVGPEPLNHVGDWLLFLNGANAFEARKCVFHNNATGEMRFAPTFPSLSASGDAYRVGRAAELFNDGPAPQECATGVTDYRMVVFLNNTGEQLVNVRAWLKPLEAKSVALEIAMGNIDIGATGIPPISVDTDLPDIKSSGVDFFSTSPQSFMDRRDFATASETPTQVSLADVNVNSGSGLPIWIRRITSPLTRPGKGAWLLVVEAASASLSGAGPWRSALVVASEPDGFTPDFTVEFDRTARTFGGAHVLARLLDASTGVPVEGIDVEFELTAGPGSLLTLTDPVVTDAEGVARAEYIAPENEAQAGATVTVQARFGG